MQSRFNMVTEEQKSPQAVAQEINDGNEFLYKFKSLFPFELFPDEVILDKLKITIIQREAIIYKRVTTIPLTGTVNVQISRGILTSQISIIETSTLKQEEVIIKHVLNSDAARFHQIVEGIVIGMRQGINFIEMNKDETLTSAKKWGAVEIDTV